MSIIACGDQLCSQIEQAYGLEKISVVVPLLSPGEGLDSFAPAAYKIEVGEQVFCLKQHRSSKTKARIAFEQRFQLAANQVESELVPGLIERTDGGWHLDWEGRTYWVERLKPGQHYLWWQMPAFSQDTIFSNGAALALFHNVSRTIKNNQHFRQTWLALDAEFSKHPSVIPATSSNLSNLTAWLGDLAARSSSQAGLEGLPERLANNLGGLDEKIRELKSAPIADTSVFIHGDFHCGNVLMQDQLVTAILDFEYVRQEHPAFDVGYALAMYCRQRRFDGWTELDLSRARTFLQGYLQSASSQLAGWIEAQSALRTIYLHTALASGLTAGWLMERYLEGPLEQLIPVAGQFLSLLDSAALKALLTLDL